MKKLISVILIFSFLIAHTLTASANLYGESEIQKFLIEKFLQWKNKINLEFIQTARQGIVTPIVGKPTHYKIKLQGLDNYVIYYSTRPKRITGIVSSANFYKVWNEGKNNFNKTPPNAVLESEVMRSNSGKQLFYVFVLSHPQYHASANTVTYDAKLLSKQHLIQRNRPHKIGFTTLFIDDFSTSWHGSIP